MTSLQALASNLWGSLIVPSDERYQKARETWSGLITTRPLAIARCEDTADVVEVVRYAQANGIPLSVKGGGHDVEGRALCEGVVIDCSGMRSITLDSSRHVARVGSGNTGGNLINHTQRYGLIATTGNMSSVGVTGLVLGGGYGPIMGSCGLVTDNVVSFTMVTATGEVVKANQDEHPDLFFGLRGGGGNFGCVTDFTIQLHPAQRLLAGLLAFPIEQASQVITRYSEVMQQAPDALTTTIGFTTFSNRPVLYLNFVYYDETLWVGEQLLNTFLSFGNAVVNTVAPVSYFDLIDKSGEGAPFGRNYYLKTVNLASLPSPSWIVSLLLQRDFLPHSQLCPCSTVEGQSHAIGISIQLSLAGRTISW